MTATFTYHCGEPVIVDLVVDDAGVIDPATLQLSMQLKRGTKPPPRWTAALGDFAFEFIPATAEELAYWRGTYQGTALEPGDYVTDAVIAIGGEVRKVSEYLVLRILGTVSAA